MNAVDVAAVSEPASHRAAVSSLDALRRACTGLGLCVALLSIIGLLWRDALEMTSLFVILTSLFFLYAPEDRHSRTAILAASTVSIAIGVGLTLLLQPDEPAWSRDVACAALAAFAGSQIYAVCTRRPA